MKLSELMEVTERLKSAVSGAIQGAEAKFVARLETLAKQLDDLGSGKAALEREFKGLLDVQNEEILRLRGDLSEQAGTRVGVKSIAGEGKTLLVGLTDGSIEEIELDIPVIPGPAGPMGISGVDGKNGTSGVDGKDGSPGKDGLDGSSGVDGADGVNGVDGKDGRDGVDGIGIKGSKVLDGYMVYEFTNGEEFRVEIPQPVAPADPRNPVDITDALIDRSGELTIVFSNGTTKNVGKIVGRDGIDGINGRDGIDGPPGERGPAGLDGYNGVDGRDGLGFDDMDVEMGEDGRTFTFKFVRGDTTREKSFKVPVMIYRGAYEPDRVYEAGDVVSYLGATYHANAETLGNVPGASEAWTQQNAAGRTVKGPRGDSGRDGRNGRDAHEIRPPGPFA